MLDTPKKETTIDVAAIREQVRGIKEREGLSWQKLSDESGVPQGTLSPFVGGTYLGNNERVAADLARWLDTRAERARTATILPPVPDFLMTPTAQDIFAALSFAQAATDFTVLVGSPGLGKTTALEAYCKRSSNVWMITADHMSKTASSLLAVLAERMGVQERRSAFVGRAIAARVRGSNGLVIIDDAQQLDATAFDQLRTSVLDMGECGIAVSGNAKMLVALQGSADTRTLAFAQLHSRVGMKKPQSNAKPGDIVMLLDAWGIAAADVRKLLTVIAGKSGALRIMNKVIRLACMLAGTGTVVDITTKHIELAWQQLASSPLEG